MTQIGPTLERFRKEKVSVVVTVGTKASIETLKIEKVLPVVFTGVAYSEPVVKAAKDNGNANVTGACYGNSVESALSAALKIKPGIKSIGMLVNSLEPNTKMDGDSLETACKKLGLKALLLPYGGESELTAAFPKLLSQNPDCVLFPKDTAQIRGAGELAKTVASKKILALGLDPAYAVKKAAILSATTPAGKIGELSARKAIEILKGKAPVSIAVEAPAEFELTLNKKAAAEVGIAIPADVLKTATQVLEE
jgi:putative ABC transport system substrate-binding protein